MGDLVPFAPPGAGEVTLAASRAAFRAVVGSQAGYLLDLGDAETAAKAITPALRASLPVAAAEANARLVAAEPAAIVAKLSPLLALTAGVGMVGGARTEWLAAAVDALRGIPPDLLERGTRAARSEADHPSKIIPLILAEVKGPWRERLRERGKVAALAALAARPPAPEPAQPRCTPAEAREIMAGLGIATDDGEPRQRANLPTGNGLPGRMPTREWYIAHGVDPAILDAIEAETTQAALGQQP